MSDTSSADGTHETAQTTALDLIEEQAEASIRRVWHDGAWHFSVIDVIGVLTDSPSPGAYWRKLKQRMKEDEGAHETVTNCHTLRMTAADGKQRLTDAAVTRATGNRCALETAGHARDGRRGNACCGDRLEIGWR